jgi:hypothetical protein
MQGDFTIDSLKRCDVKRTFKYELPFTKGKGFFFLRHL